MNTIHAAGRSGLPRGALPALVVMALVLAACAPVKDEAPAPAPAAVAAGPNDQAEFAQRKLAPQFLAAPVAARLPASNPPSLAWRGLTIGLDTTTVESNGRAETSHTVQRYSALGRGLVQRAAQFSKVGIEQGTTYSLSWHGLIDLRRQEAPLRNAVLRPVVEIKAVQRFDALATDLGRESRFEYSTGLESQAGGYLPVQLECRNVRRLPGATLHAGIAGDAIELDCRLRGGPGLQATSKWMWLLSYGVAVELEQARAGARSSSRIVAFSRRG